MQVLPSVGQEMSRSLRFPVWYPALLLDADANLQLGTAHLASYIRSTARCRGCSPPTTPAARA